MSLVSCMKKKATSLRERNTTRVRPKMRVRFDDLDEDEKLRGVRPMNFHACTILQPPVAWVYFIGLIFRGETRHTTTSLLKTIWRCFEYEPTYCIVSVSQKRNACECEAHVITCFDTHNDTNHTINKKWFLQQLEHHCGLKETDDGCVFVHHHSSTDVYSKTAIAYSHEHIKKAVFSQSYGSPHPWIFTH